MKRILPAVVFLLALAVCPIVPTGSVLGITPGEVFEDGRRAFVLGHWQEARDAFRAFEIAWPAHGLVDRAVLFQTLAEIRGEQAFQKQEFRDRLASYSGRLARLKDRLPEEDLTELEVAIELLQARGSEGRLASPGAVLRLEPKLMKHFLDRGWFPVPADQPIETLRWIAMYRDNFPGLADLPLRSTLHLMQARALWQLYLSPLPRKGCADLLKGWKLWPVPDALRQALEKAFATGDLTAKREAALIGVSFESLERIDRRVVDSPWYRYLQDRGIHGSEAWCPR